MTDTERSEPNGAGDSPGKPTEIRSRTQYETLLAEASLVLAGLATAGCGICTASEPERGTIPQVAPGREFGGTHGF